jgi:uncharacterized RDD family membrane protein YckC
MPSTGTNKIITLGQAGIDSYAGPAHRIAAFGIDSIILGATMVAIIVISSLAGFKIAPYSLNRFNLIEWITAYPMLWIIITIIPFAYYTALEFRSGQTLGKRLIHIRVIKANGDRCDVVSVLLRTALRIIDNMIVGIMLITYTKKKQRLGDMVVGTIVIRSQ